MMREVFSTVRFVGFGESAMGSMLCVCERERKGNGWGERMEDLQ